MAMVSLGALVLALSFDSLIAGIAYGLRGIKVPLKSLLTLGLVSAAGLGASMLVGVGFGTLVPPVIARLLGGLVLIGIGAYTMLKSWLDATATAGGEAGSRVAMVRLRNLGLIVQILRDPAAADVDASGDLTVAEALTLGLALAIDALAVGASVGVVAHGWFIWLLPPAAGLGAGGFMAAGRAAGARGLRLDDRLRVTYLPGMVLMLLGLMQLVH